MHRQTQIFTLLCCAFFLAGNIAYDWLDTPENPADYRIFYVPLSLMIFALILNGKKNATKQTEPYWWFFLWLSIGQMVKFLIFNPYLQMLSDYGFLALVTIGLTIKLIKNARSSTGTK